MKFKAIAANNINRGDPVILSTNTNRGRLRITASSVGGGALGTRIPVGLAMNTARPGQKVKIATPGTVIRCLLDEKTQGDLRHIRQHLYLAEDGGLTFQPPQKGRVIVMGHLVHLRGDVLVELIDYGARAVL